MKNKKILILISLFFLLNLVYSQNPDSNRGFKSTTFTFSYFENFPFKPGLKISADIILAEYVKPRIRIRKDSTKINKTKTRQLLLGGDIGFYWHHHSHTGMFNYYEISYRTIRAKGFQTTIGIGPGIYRAFYPETYEIDNSNNITKKSFAGRTYFSSVILLGYGRYRKNATLQSWHLKYNIMFLFDYNTGIMPLFNIELGFCFDFLK